MPSNIRTYVQWRDSTIFAGEEIECIITFKNVARTPAQRERDRAEGSHSSRVDALRPILERQRNVTQSTAFTKPTLGRLPSIASGPTASIRRGHRASLSVGVEPNTPPRGLPDAASPASGTVTRPRIGHGRSLSILSFTSDQRSPAAAQGPGRPSPRSEMHNRSTSLQILSKPPSRQSPTAAHSPTITVEEPETANGSPRGGRRKSGVNTAPTTPALPASGGGDLSAKSSTEFRFSGPAPVVGGSEAEDFGQPALTSARRNRGEGDARQPNSPISPRDVSGLHPNQHNSINRVLSEASVDGTPRSSEEIYAMSNDSDETVNSELPGQVGSKLLPRQSMSRQSSQRKARPHEPEHLMMGYAQCMGSFSLDGSLVNQAPFEEVKRKGVMSSQAGGGVVGVERSKRESGLFGAFGWSNIGESLTGLLGMDDMSSMREMNRIAEMKNIPLLSTPQSILFVDLRLGPGESRSYTYRFKLPKGLPPSHKGRAIKVSYHLRLAVQRSGSIESRNVKDVEIPFRVLGSVDRCGELLGHDLMSPYVMLQDTAKTAPLPDSADPIKVLTSDGLSKPKTTPAAGMDDFLRYTERLMAEQPAGAPLMSPTAMEERRFSMDVPQPKTQKERIDLAILRSNQAPVSPSEGPAQSSNTFTINRGGRHVGVLTILRPAYRLGETVLVNIDFAPPPFTAIDSQTASNKPDTQKTYLITISLETTERVDPSLALRSTSSINRATRKVYASATDTVFFAQQATFSLEIPPNVSPTFETTGVRLQWRIRVEFTTSVLNARRASRPARDAASQQDDEDEAEEGEEELDEKNGMLSPPLPSDEPIGASLRKSKHRRNTSQPESGEESAEQSPDDWPEESWLSAGKLLENVSSDERGRILVAREMLAAESFEVNVPIRVYGVKGTEGGGKMGVSDILEI